MESLDDGNLSYYNSNILGRYMRKDYGHLKELEQTLKNTRGDFEEL